MLLMVSCVYGLDKEMIGIDIVGSHANNTTIIPPCGEQVDVEVVGGTTDHFVVGCQKEAPIKNNYCCNTCCCDCKKGKCYTTPWDDFRRPLCYPWSSYIPTRYNRPLFNCHAALDSNHEALKMGLPI